MTEYLVYDAPNGHPWKFFAFSRDEGPWVTYCAEHMGSGERILYRVDHAAPAEFRRGAIDTLMTMVAEHPLGAATS
jgi:hypothetical protein